MPQPPFGIDTENMEADLIKSDCYDQVEGKETKKKIYQQRYRKQWEKMPAFKGWLRSVPGKDYQAMCKLCGCLIKSKLKNLESHRACKKHINASRNLDSLPESIFHLETIEQNDPVEELGESKTIAEKIGFIGAGNIAQAIIKGFILKGVVKKNQIMVSAPSDRHLPQLKSLGVMTTHDNQEVVNVCDVVFLAVKPHLIKAVLEELHPFVEPLGPLFVSVAAGISIERIESLLLECTLKPRVVRVMPNTPCLVLEGCCAYCLGTFADYDDGQLIQRMLNALGVAEEIEECHMDAVCGLSGSGPAYIYVAIEAMADGAVKLGLPRATALKFASQTVLGAASMVKKTGMHPAVLKDEVCSPGGTTISALHSLEKSAFRSSLISAVEAAALKFKELSSS